MSIFSIRHGQTVALAPFYKMFLSKLNLLIYFYFSFTNKMAANFVYFDLETSGTAGEEIIQIGAVGSRNSDPKFSVFAYPKGAISIYATNIHGISMVKTLGSRYRGCLSHCPCNRVVLISVPSVRTDIETSHLR